MERELCSWSSGMKVSSVMTRLTSGILRSRSAVCRRVIEIGREHVDGVRAGVRIVAQIEEGRDQFDLRAAQIDRVEVKLQIVEQRQPAERDHRGADDDRNAVPLHESDRPARATR